MRKKKVQSKKSSKSTYTKWLIVREDKSQESGLSFINRQLYTKSETPYKKKYGFVYFWLLLLALSLSFLFNGLTVFNIEINPIIIILINCIFCFGMTRFYQNQKLDGKRRYITLGLVLLYMLFRFIFRDSLQAGELRFLSNIALTTNKYYQTSFVASLTGTSFDLHFFICIVCFWLDLIIGSCTVLKMDILLLSLILWPVLAILFFLSNGVITVYLVLFLILYFVVWAGSVNSIKKNLWGIKKSEQYKENKKYHTLLQFQLTKLVTIIGVCLITVSFTLGVAFSSQFSITTSLSNQMSSQIIGIIEKILPSISSGEVKLVTETIGGGMNDGSLENEKGLSLNDIDDLKITVSEPIEESIYLKGYVGSDYVDGTWTSPSLTSFKNASSGWKCEGDASLYILNLPFLRTNYATGNEASTIEIEYLDASTQYLYYPYNSYLSDENECIDGDGAVLGGLYTIYTIPYYSQTTVTDSLLSWSTNSKNHSDMDDVESEYLSYVKLHYTNEVEGAEAFEKVAEKNKMNESTNIEKVESFVIDYMHSNYTYNQNEKVDSNADALQSFLETKEGNAAQYVSAAVALFRACQVPCRYVVGYVASSGMFTEEYSGSYSAVLEDKDVHIWPEIYEEGVGWIPIEVLPGTEVTKEKSVYSQDESTEQESTVKEDTQETNSLPMEMIVFVCFVLIMGIFCLILYRYRYVHGLLSRHTNNEKILDMFQYFYARLVRKGLKEPIEITSNDFILQTCKINKNLQSEDIQDMVQIALKAKFGKEILPNQEVIKMRKYVFHTKK